MANIRVDLDYTIRDGLEIKFRSPVDCSQITGLIVYYPGTDGNTTSKVFTLADAHGNNVGDIDHLFAENVVVKVILDVTTGMAFVQNADTNAYLEAALAGKAPAGYGLGEYKGKDVSSIDPNTIKENGVYWVRNKHSNHPPDFVVSTMVVVGGHYDRQTQFGFYSNTYHRGVICKRDLYDGDYSPWEWVNPPTKISSPSSITEYRTMERFNGKPVYVHSIDLGAMPDNQSMVFTYNSAFVMTDIVDIQVDIYNDKTWYRAPNYYLTPGTFNMEASVYPKVAYGASTTNKVALICEGVWSGFNARYTIKYTKD